MTTNRLKKGVILQQLGKKAVLYDNQKSTLHELNEIGFLILSAIEKGKSQEAVARAISGKYQISMPDAKRDIENFLEELKKKGLLARNKAK